MYGRRHIDFLRSSIQIHIVDVVDCHYDKPHRILILVIIEKVVNRPRFKNRQVVSSSF